MLRSTMLTDIRDVQRQPVQECVADQLGEEQAEGKLDNALRHTERYNVVDTSNTQHSRNT